METTQQSRFKDALWFGLANRTSVVVGGAGGIGSWLTLLLSRLGTEIDIFDNDYIEAHNLGGQLYRKSSLDNSKVMEVKDICHSFNIESYVNAHARLYTEDSLRSPIIFSAFDNMKARTIMFENWLDHLASFPEDQEHALFIDGRLEMEQLQIFCVPFSRAEEYRARLFDDSEIEDAPCTLKQTSHSAAMIASLMVSFYTNHLTNVAEGFKCRRVPFFYEIFMPLSDTTLID